VFCWCVVFCLFFVCFLFVVGIVFILSLGGVLYSLVFWFCWSFVLRGVRLVFGFFFSWFVSFSLFTLFFFSLFFGVCAFFYSFLLFFVFLF